MKDVEMCDGRLSVTGLKTLLERYLDPDHTPVFNTRDEARDRVARAEMRGHLGRSAEGEDAACQACGRGAATVARTDGWFTCTRCDESTPEGGFGPPSNGSYCILADINTDEQERNLLDMDRIAALINEAGLPATVEMTGGGVATIYVGHATRWSDDEDFDRYPALAGPGTFGWGVMISTASIDEFFVGPDDDNASGLDVREVGAVTEEQIATLLVAQANRTARLIDHDQWDLTQSMNLPPDELAALGFNPPSLP